MIQLSYHPAFDAFHCIFRTLRLRDRGQLLQIEVDKLRILDYYLLFPWRATAIRLAPRDLSVRSKAKRLEAKKDYATLPNGQVLLERMRPSQTAALQTMAQDGVINMNSLRNGIVQFEVQVVSEELRKRIAERNADKEETEKLEIVDALREYPLLGPDGLKSRTSLLEYRYDKF